MIKLKTLILEYDNLVLTKLEEQNALDVILKVLSHELAGQYNRWISEKKNKQMKKKFYTTTSKEVANSIKKTDRRPVAVEYDCILKHGHIQIATEKRIDHRTGNEEVAIGFTKPTDIGWTSGSGYTWYTFNELISIADEILSGPIV